MIAPTAQSQPTWHRDFMSPVPAIRRYARFAFRHLDAAAQEEAVTEAIAAALVAYVRLVQRGLQSVIYPSPLARYAVHHVRNGRHVGGHENNGDMLSPTAQQRHGFQVKSLHCRRNGWVDRLVTENGRATPADTAAARVDCRDWLGTLSGRNRKIAQALAEGSTTNETAKRFGLSAARISQLRREFQQSWQSFQGELSQAT